MLKTLLIFLLLTTNCYALQWERIVNNQVSLADTIVCFRRASIPHGWLLISCNGSTLTFVPDEKHEWRC